MAYILWHLWKNVQNQFFGYHNRNLNLPNVTHHITYKDFDLWTMLFLELTCD